LHQHANQRDPHTKATADLQMVSPISGSAHSIVDDVTATNVGAAINQRMGNCGA
jgi:hypothetical protein